ncbi:putative integral membrane protein [Mycobacteroides abscessus]|nr:putative integral membrane protein [Mycobacteroides abscessus]SKK67838.1 putative integral membrane protein [Mycobacteroides abscessus subsp. massiliense]CPU63277.1 putative integral membrane protein [Mycobacteroides abscessus]SKQ42686.1 integral membrane protein [Mycobacteroides abscessus subsp. massiliense]SKV98021.1 putative integral membrane protein [Mycobacteroides abscessus subsp. massiliense]
MSSCPWRSVESGIICSGVVDDLEGLASIIIVWRFTGSRTLSEHAEARAQKAVAITFFLLAPYIAYDAITTLVAGEHPQTSWVGIGLSITSLIVMPILGRAKRRLGTQLGSVATSSEGTQNLLCAYLAGAVLRQPVPVDNETMKKAAEISGGNHYDASTAAELKDVYGNLEQQIGYETFQGDASPVWVKLAAIVLALVADKIS